MSDSMRRQETKSDHRSEKQQESDEIERLTAEFLQRGGKIVEVPPGISGCKLEASYDHGLGRSTWKRTAHKWTLDRAG